MTFELLVLDCDGVLVDSERLAHEVLVQLLAEVDIQLTTEAAFDTFLGRSTAQCVDILNAMLGRDVGVDMMRSFRQRLREAFETGLRALPNIEAALDEIRLPWCVASSGEIEKMRLSLGLTGLLPRFEGRLVSVTEVAHPKPAPDVYLLAAHRFGADARACVAVEDSPTGVAAAVAAGMTVVGYAGHTPAAKLMAAGAHQVIADMARLPALIAAGKP
ncbi:HAD-IA family hydrolase [Povalibacter sp.]|uniref:HAD family hydrolase n=1 Tax=Povalibacter sp. TaxID=1962978 RepID=UPI002F40F674